MAIQSASVVYVWASGLNPHLHHQQLELRNPLCKQAPLVRRGLSFFTSHELSNNLDLIATQNTIVQSRERQILAPGLWRDK